MDDVTLDRALILGILQQGKEAFFRSRELGLRSDHIQDSEQKVYALFEEMIRKNQRLPTLIEIKAATDVSIVVPDVAVEPFDPGLFGARIAERALMNKLKDGLGPITREVLTDPTEARKHITELVKDTAWSLGSVDSYTDPTIADTILAAYDRAKSHRGGLLGYSSPWKNVDRHSMGLQPSELTVILAKRKTGKSASASTKLVDPDTGRIRTIKEVVKGANSDVLTWAENSPIHVATPSDYLYSGVKKCVKITFKSGRVSIPATTHPFMTPGGWVEAGKLKEGQHCAAVAIMPEPRKPVVMDVNEMTALLCEHGITGKKSIEKVIPDAIFSLPNEQLALFLGRLWSCDGSIDKRGNVNYSTGSRNLADQVQHLLLRFGVTSRVRTITRKIEDGAEERDYYEVLVHKERIENFKRTVGANMIGPKFEKLQQVKFRGRSRVGWLRSEELRDQIRAEMDGQPDLLRMFDSRSGRINKRIFRAFCEVYDSKLKWVLDENIQWDEIVTIEMVGDHPCYDLSVPETECFIADDMVTHNTWILLKWFVHILRNDLKPGESILIASMEMSPVQMYRRMAAIDLRLDYADFRSGRLTVEEERRLKDWVERMRDGDESQPTIHVAGADVIRSVGDICDKVAELDSKLVGLDGMYILGRDSKKGMWERTVDNVSDLKLELCAGMEIGCLATSQFRGGKNKNELDADADDAAYAKAIGDWADAMRGLFMNNVYEKNRKRVFRAMESREFQGVDLVINFDLVNMNFAEDHVITGEGDADDTPFDVDAKKKKKKRGSGDDDAPVVLTGRPELSVSLEPEEIGF